MYITIPQLVMFLPHNRIDANGRDVVNPHWTIILVPVRLYCEVSTVTLEDMLVLETLSTVTLIPMPLPPSSTKVLGMPTGSSLETNTDSADEVIFDGVSIVH